MIGFSDVKNTEERIVLEAAFRVLNMEERQIVVLHAVSGLKHKEISQIVKKPLSTVLSKYNRAIKKLEKAVGEDKIYE
jgi:RNA polymerase sigma-70 factor (ECF subfamily)